MKTDIPFGVDDWGLLPGDLSRIKLRNMFLGENPFNKDGISRYIRPSLDLFTTVGTGPVTFVFSEDNVFQSDLFVVSAETLFRVNPNTLSVNSLGNLPGVGQVEATATSSKLVFCRDGKLYYYDGALFAQIPTPDNVLIASVAQINEYVLVSVKDSVRFYWIVPGATTIDPLNFASAERVPDQIVSIRSFSDEIWFIGTKSVEVWYNTGDAIAPFSRVAGRAYSYGTMAAASCVTSSYQGLPCVFWVSTDNEVILGQGGVKVVSTASVKHALSESPVLFGWCFSNYQYNFYVVTTNSRTLVYNLQKNSWASWDSYGFSYWLACSGTNRGTKVFSGDSTSNKLYTLGVKGSDEGSPIVCQLTGFLGSTDSFKTPCNKVSVILNTGWVRDYQVAPVLELTWSDNGGFEWSSPVQSSLGQKGQYDQVVEFRSLGSFSKPGRTFELTFSQLENCRIDLAWME